MLKALLTRRFNYVDTCAVTVFVVEIDKGQYGWAVMAFLLGLLLSVVLERHYN